MPPINPIEEIKEVLPDTKAATAQLAKSDDGAFFTIALVLLIISVIIFLYTAIHFADPVSAARKEQAEQDRKDYAQTVADYKHTDTLQRNTIAAQADYIHTLKDSLMQYKMFQQFNIITGKKQIIIIPKEAQ